MRVLSFILLTALLCTSLCTRAQRYDNSFQARYKELAKQETHTMDERYHLSTSQLHEIALLNDKYYADVNAVFSDRNNKTHAAIAGKIAVIRDNRESVLQKLFTATQYAAYRKDMDIQEARVRERMKRQNEYSKHHPFSIKPARPNS